MRAFLPVLSFFLLPAACVAQDTITRYWIGAHLTNVKAKAKTEAKYYQRDGLWYAESRFLSNGKVYMTGSYKEPEAKTKHGEFKWYHENGAPSQIATYRDGKREGLVKAWHKNGVLEDSFFYKADRCVNKCLSWNESGVLTLIYDLDENGTGRGRTYRSKDSLYSEGGFLNGYRSGPWSYYAPKGYKEWEVEYLTDSVINARCFNETGMLRDECIWAREAEPAGGLKGWKKYLEKILTNSDYPSRKLSKREKNLSGNVWVRFVVDKDGSLTDIEIIRSLNEEADAIVIAAMQKAPRWTPAIQKNRLVKTYFTQPVSFVLGD